ncbi:TPA: hypothetical protein L4E46_003930 [Pseudomonas aeruginosa]|nr:hypothetical protein [Pseudomonas aeruginosa]MDP5825640.1 hypothetical protein [Pseudomonas aeruginosa]HBO1022123.1 hypothetical protein [Pseudomonas aeruginosa]
MNDRTLLELAARAAGMNIQRSRLNDPLHRDFLMNGEGVRNPGQCSFPWNPLTDDGDALRLASSLEMDLRFIGAGAIARAHFENSIWPKIKDDDYKRAIVRAAAEIGKSITQPGATSSP